MSDIREQNFSDTENLCVLCFKNVSIYSVGVCDHPVCFECSTRMRVLCRQNECPICRGDLPKVIFTKFIEPFSVLYLKYERTSLQDSKFGFLFCTYEIQKAYYRLLEHRCDLCGDSQKRIFKTFQLLKDHMRREHELFYCDICEENVKIFSTERRKYNRQELGMHRRKGDPDNTSHRGHPLCEFCDMRFMDSDDLFRHLRRTHLYCHFCDADGRNLYYNSIGDLQKHFRAEHYLCEEGECKAVPMAAAFRTHIDLKAHIAAEHGRSMSKSANKQARTLELEFTLAPRSRPDIRTKRAGGYRDEEGAVGGVDEPGGGGFSGGGLERTNFPSLGSQGSNTFPIPSGPSFANFNPTKKFSSQDFPSLGGGAISSRPATSSGFTISTNSLRGPQVSITRNSNEFPALPAASRESILRLSVKGSNQDSAPPKVSLQVNHKPNGVIHTHITASNNKTAKAQQSKQAEAFPALRSEKAPSLGGKNQQPQWVQMKPTKKHEEKNVKVASATPLAPSDKSQFPDLKNTKKSSSVSIPVSNDWVNLNNFTKNQKAKKEQPVKIESPIRDTISQERTTGDDGKSKKKKKGKSLTSNNNNNINLSALNDRSAASVIEALRESSISSTTPEPKILTSNSNGVIKKRSEIKISPLSVPESNNVQGQKKTPPPGFSSKPPPPPGFTKFSNENFPSLGYSNDLTFTTSSGQSYSITPSNSYKQPSNFTTRNQNIIKKLTMVSTEDAIRDFKTYSDMFRNNSLSPEKYYEHCRKFLGHNFDEFFNELLVLLPDVNKQRELFKVYSGKAKKNLVLCENCQQVIFKKELSEHYSYHALDNQFSSLGNAKQMDSAWGK